MNNEASSSSKPMIDPKDNPLLRPKPTKKKKQQQPKQKQKNNQSSSLKTNDKKKDKDPNGNDQKSNGTENDEERTKGEEDGTKIDDDELLDLLINQTLKGSEPSTEGDENDRKGSKDGEGSGGDDSKRPKRKLNRQKERLARREAEKESLRDSARSEIIDQPDQRQLELDDLNRICNSLNLRIVEMNPDGHCLYSSIADQLNLYRFEGHPFDHKSLRILTSEFMRRNVNDFINYLIPRKRTSSKSDDYDDDDGGGGGIMTEEEYFEHCDLIRDSAEWGGQPEILALSRYFKTPIHIVQAFQPTLKVSPFDDYESEKDLLKKEKKEKKDVLMISYHRKSYGLGEHYNSLRPID